MSPRSRIVLPPNTLKNKVGNGGFDPKVLEKAQTAIDNNKIEFAPFAYEVIGNLTSIIDDVKKQDRPLEDLVKDVLFPITQLNAHGSMFKYGSMSRMSVIIIDFLEALVVVDIRFMTIISAYRDAVKALLNFNIMKESDPSCVALCKALTEACDRYQKSIETS